MFRAGSKFLHADDLTIRFNPSADDWLDVAALEELDENASIDELISVWGLYRATVATMYDCCVKTLQEIGIEPLEQTKALYAHLRSGKEVLKGQPVSTKPVSAEPVSNISVPLTSFVGRENELKEISRLLSSSRL